MALPQCAAVPPQEHVVGGRHSRPSFVAMARPARGRHDLGAARHHDGPHRVDSRGCRRPIAVRLSPGGRRSHRASAEGHDRGENALLANASRARCDRHAAADATCIRRGDWKYVDDRGQYFLFNLRTDPGERHDLAQEHGDRIRELRSLVAKWEADVDAEAKQRSTESAERR